MGDGNGLGKIGIAFLVVMGISAAAAVPFLTHPKPAAAPPVIEAPPEPEPEPVIEAPPEPAPKATKPKAKKKSSTSWNGGGDTTSEISAVGRNGKIWFCTRCRREWGSAGIPPAFVQCCGVSYFNGKAKSHATPGGAKK